MDPHDNNRAEKTTRSAQTVPCDKVMLLTEQLISDMRNHPQSFNPSIINMIVHGIDETTREELIDFYSNNPREPELDAFIELMVNNYRIDAKMIADSVRPNDLSQDDWWNLWAQYTIQTPNTLINDMSFLPAGYHDIIMLGLPRSGNTTLLAALLHYSTVVLGGQYEPHLVDGHDKSASYYQAMRKVIPMRKFPNAAASDTVCYFHIIAQGKKTTFIEHGDEQCMWFADSRNSEASLEVWERCPLNECLKSKNPKTLLFIVDCSSKNDTMWSVRRPLIRQSLEFEKMVEILCSDGPNQNKPEKDCTMSRVEKMAIVFTKADTLDGEPTIDSWIPQIDALVHEHFVSLYNKLNDACRKYGINSKYGNKICILPHSIGRPNVGDCFTPDLSTTAGVAKFIFNY